MSDNIRNYSTGGQITTTFAGTGTGDLQLYTGPGRLCNVAIVTGGITFTRFYDSSTTSGAATAVQIFVTAQTTTSSTGAKTEVQMPFTNGLLVSQVASVAACVVTYNKNTTYGR
jgi:hypothetical protein